MSDDSNMSLKERLAYIGWKQRLVAALLDRGISASADDSLKDLIDKVLTIPIQSELVLEGDAIAADVLSGKDFYSDDWSEKLTGTMPDNGGEDQEISAKADEKSPSEGFHDGTGVIKIADAEQAKIIAENIKNGVTVLGVPGSLQSLDTSDATADALDLATGETAYVNGVKVTGARRMIIVSGDWSAVPNIRKYDTKNMYRSASHHAYAFGAGLGMYTDGTYLYGSFTIKIQKYNKGDLSYVSESGAGSGWVSPRGYCIAGDGTLMFVGGKGFDKWTIPATYNARYDYGGNVYALFNFDSTYVLCGGDTIKKVHKVQKSNLSKNAESGDYGGTIYAIIYNGTNIFAGGATTQKVFKYDTSLNKLAESADYGGTINAIWADSTHVFVAGATTQKIRKYLISDMSFVSESADYGGTINALIGDDQYLYAGGGTTKKVYQYLKSDLSKVAETETLPDIIRAIIFE